MNKIKVLHVFEDEKFFDNVSSFFNSIQILENIYAICLDKKYTLKFIKNIDLLTIYYSFSDYSKLFSSQDIDVIYFHSLSPTFFRLYRYISKDKIVIWWAWGYDLYSTRAKLPPLISIKLYKPLTEGYRRLYRTLNFSLHNLLLSIAYPILLFQRRRLITRIDYFTPVLHSEYELLKNNCNFFRAKPFMLRGGPGNVVLVPFFYKSVCGNILVGNSLSWENNLLDIFHSLEQIELTLGRQIVCPISYGDGYGGKENIKNLVKDTNLHIKWLDDFLPIKEYQKINEGITHAIFGSLRQQSMGNINYCLRHSIKVYLYKDSMIYKDLKDIGFKVFTIEDDLVPNSLNTPLSYEDSFTNYMLFKEILSKKEEYTLFEFERLLK